ncbi:MAG: hypothetical protein MZV63_23920 [Marinilabiliales bacterium]|nr:hypothetical protein [Marinilabiliales bacterium]
MPGAAVLTQRARRRREADTSRAESRDGTVQVTPALQHEVGRDHRRARSQRGVRRRQPAGRPAAERAADGPGLVAARGQVVLARRRTGRAGPQGPGAGHASARRRSRRPRRRSSRPRPGRSSTAREYERARVLLEQEAIDQKEAAAAARRTSMQARTESAVAESNLHSLRAGSGRRSTPCCGARGSRAKASSTMTWPTPTCS